MKERSQELFLNRVFLREHKTRFLCSVELEGQEVECYIPASCKLSKFVDLSGKQVILQPVKKSEARTHYAVYAAKFGRSYILLNLAEANRIVEEQLYRRYFSFLGKRKRIHREYTVEGYKTDLFIEDTNTLIEVKTLLAFNQEGCFPSMNSKRAVQQLEKISSLLDSGYKVCYIILSLNSAVAVVKVNSALREYYRLFQECLRKGMDCRGFSVKLKDIKPEIYGKVEIRM